MISFAYKNYYNLCFDNLSRGFKEIRNQAKIWEINIMINDKFPQRISKDCSETDSEIKIQKDKKIDTLLCLIFKYY